MNERQYYDADGNPCTLLRLCKSEPEWAANRIEASAKEERNRIADALDLKASTASMEKKYSIAIAFRTFAERLRKGEV